MRYILSIGTSFAICVLLFAACDNEDPVRNEVVFAPVNALQINVDKANFTGTCPHTFKFSGVITTSGTGIVQYRFRDIDHEFDFLVEGSLRFNSAGSQTVTAEYEFIVSAAGRVVLEIPSANFLSSELVEITATCR